MTGAPFPSLAITELGPTRDALHAYARVLGGWLKACRPRRKHWWHASLRPSLRGLTTGPVYCGTEFELELDCIEPALRARTSTGVELTVHLRGQSARELGDRTAQFLVGSGLDEKLVPGAAGDADKPFPTFSASAAAAIGATIRSVTAALESLRAGIREETSAIQIWPHHFDVSMVWLPGGRVEGQDGENEEHADKQMNFGFAFGDAEIPEPYFYVTAYPEPSELRSVALPAGAEWHSRGFSGVVLMYRQLLEHRDPHELLIELWTALMAGSRPYLVA